MAFPMQTRNNRNIMTGGSPAQNANTPQTGINVQGSNLREMAKNMMASPGQFGTASGYAPPSQNLWGDIKQSQFYSNPQGIMDTVADTMSRSFARNQIPGIQQGFSGAGQYGSSRHGIAEGLATSELQRNLANQLSQIQFQAEQQAQAQRLAAAQLGIGENADAQARALQASLGAGGILGGLEQQDIASQASLAGSRAGAGATVSAAGIRAQSDMAIAQLQDAFRRAQLEEQARQFGGTLGLDYNRIAADLLKFGGNLGLDYSRLGQQESQFGRSLGLDYSKLAENARQFGGSLGLDYARLGENARQFDYGMLENARQFGLGLGERGRQFDAGNLLGQAQLGEVARGTNLDALMGLTRVGEDARQFGQTNALNAYGMGLQGAQMGYQMPFTGANQLMNVGDIQQQHEQRLIAELMARHQFEQDAPWMPYERAWPMLSGLGNMGGTSNRSSESGGGLSGILGGAAQGYGLSNILFGGGAPLSMGGFTGGPNWSFVG